jgi:hypothetical protein
MFSADVGRTEQRRGRTMRIRGALAFAAVGLLTLSAAACGDDDDKGGDATTTAATTTTATSGSTASSSGGDASSATEADYLAAIEAQFTATGDDSMELSDKQAKCVAPKWLDVITVDKLKEKGITPDEVRSDTDNEKLATIGLSEGDANQMYAAFGDCDVDVQAKVAESVVASSELPAECVQDALSADLVERIFVVSVTKGEAGLDADEALSNELFSALGKCAPTTTT